MNQQAGGGDQKSGCQKSDKPIEPIDTRAELAKLAADEYLALGDTAPDRVRGLLGRLDSVRRSEERGSELSDEAIELSHKFMGQVETIFSNLPKPVTWRSFYNNDLGILDVPQEILDWAIAGKLNKEQTKQLAKLDADEYLALGDTAPDRVRGLLGRLDAVRISQTRGNDISGEAKKSVHKFMDKVETIFSTLPKPATWRSFYNNDRAAPGGMV